MSEGVTLASLRDARMHSCALGKNNFTHWEVMIPINIDSVHILHRKRIYEISWEFTFSSSHLKRTSLNASRPRAKSHCFIEACRNTRSLNLQLLVLRIRIINCTDRSLKKKTDPIPDLPQRQGRPTCCDGPCGAVIDALLAKESASHIYPHQYVKGTTRILTSKKRPALLVLLLIRSEIRRSPVDMLQIFHYLPGFQSCQVVFSPDFWTINRSN